jgi:putative acetyltransferase
MRSVYIILACDRHLLARDIHLIGARPMIVIREEKPEDAADIRQVNEQAFGQAAEANLVDALRAHGKVTLSLVAEQDGKIVGHILFSPVTITAREQGWPAAGLAPMAVLPEFQKQGIGSQLIQRGLDECRDAGIACVAVLGHPDYYPRFGFVPASNYGIRCEYDVPDEVFMIIELRNGALNDCAGVIRYQPEFNEV